MIGRTLSRFRITAKLGEGGMGEVYRAVDTTLGREVAIKVLGERVSQDVERLERFEREARVLASLNHPHVAALYEVGQTELGDRGRLPFLVMELVEGSTLATHLARGPLPLRQALEIADQVAQALEAAHEKGIVHRDLKPANVIVRSDGQVKVLDFGLARVFEEAGASSHSTDLMSSPTLADHHTRAGVLMGTAAYMSPEQARGKPVDKRTDVWAFGCLLFEALAGKPLFQRDTVTDTLASIVHDEPDWGSLLPEVPSGIRRLLRRCLSKDVKQRLRDMGDIRLGLQDAAAEAGTGTGEGSRRASGAESHAARVPATRRTGPWISIGLALLLGLGIGWSLSGRGRARDGVSATVRFEVPPPPDVLHLESPTLSNDGQLLVYRGIGASDRLYLRELGSFETRRVPESEGARNPFFSGDDRWLFFFSRGKLRKISVRGGNALELCDVATDTPGGAWGPGNTVLYSSWLTGIYQVPADGGAPAPLTRLASDQREAGHWWPQVVPGDRWVVFTIWVAGAGLNDARVGILDLKGGAHRALFPGSFARYADPGYLVYYHAGSHYAVGFDPARGTPENDPTPVREDIATLDPTGTTFKGFSMARNGTLAFLPRLKNLARIAWVDLKGRQQPWPFEPRPIRGLDLSPDGRRLLVEGLQGGLGQISILETERATEQTLQLEGSNATPRWDPTGERLAYTSLRRGSFDVYTKGLDVGSREEAVLDDPSDTSVKAWAPAGKGLLVLTYDYEKHKNYFGLKRPGTSQPVEVVLSSGGDLGNASVSPDGRWLAYESSDEGGWTIDVQPLGTAGQRIKLTPSGGSQALWSPRASELFYRRGREVRRVRFRAPDAGPFQVLDDQSLFELPVGTSDDASWSWDIAPDGQRFVVMIPEAEEAPRVKVVLRWTEELRRSFAKGQ